MTLTTALLALLACGGSTDSATSGTNTGTTVTNTTTTIQDGDIIVEASATSGDVPTVVKVSFTLSREATASVVYSIDGGSPITTPSVSGAGPHEVLLLGAPGVTPVAFSIQAEDAAGTAETTPEASVSTGQLLPGVASFTLTTDAGGYDPGYIVGVLISEDESYESMAFVLNRAGQVVWYYVIPAGLLSPDMRFPNDGKSGFWFNVFDKTFDTDLGEIRRMGWAGAEVENVRTELGHHTFERLSDGSLAYPKLDIREHTFFNPQTGSEETAPVCGEALVELAPDGTPRTVWSSWDHVDHVWNDGWRIPFYGDMCYDALHANQLAYDESKGTYLLSFANTDQVVEIDKATGATVRWFGSPNNLFKGEVVYAFAAGSTPFAFQHGSHFLPNGNLLTSSKYEPGGQAKTVVLEYSVDEGTQELTEVWSFGKDRNSYAQALGEAWRLDNGHTLLNTGSNGKIIEVDAAGTVLWEVDAPLGVFYGRTWYIDDLYKLY